MKSSMVKNTLILIITSMIIRILSLVNRIILTRLLGHEGISLYVIVLPSLSLFMSIAGFSLNIATTKIVAENTATKKYSEKQILSSATIIGLFTSAISILILLIIIKPLISIGLKQESAFFPILSCIFFLPLIALNNIFRGYYNGKNKMNISSYAILTEQISRIITSVVLLYIFVPFGLVVAVSMAILAMGLGELISLLYIIFLIKKRNLENLDNNCNPKLAILRISLPTTATRLVGNITYFLEPIIYTAALSIIGFSTNDILIHYSAITAYGIPLITLCTFISTSIATVVMPNVSRSYAAKNFDEVNHYLKKALILSFVPSILVSILISSYSSEYMMLIYNTTTGSNYAKSFGLIFILYYIQMPLVGIMQAIGRSKYLFRLSLITSIIKLILIFSLSFIPSIGYNSLIFALLINIFITTPVLYFYLKKQFQFKFSSTTFINIIIIFVLTFLLLYILKAGNVHYLLSTFIIILSFIISSKVLKITSLNNK